MVVLELLAGVGGKVDMVGYPLALIPKWSLGLKLKFQREEMKKEPAQKQSLDNTLFIREFVATNCTGGCSKATEKIKKALTNYSY